MSSTKGLKQASNPLHVYRHLLREASYLPPVCRICIEPRIQLRFRRNRKDETPEKRLRGALHDLRNLRAANLGNMDRMRKVMMLTFGRIGWRRHELLKCFRQPEQPQNSTQLEADLRSQDSHTPATRDWLDSWDKDKLLTFAKSQASRSLRSSPRPQAVLKRLDPSKAVPPINIWGKPFAAKPARSKEQKWWRQVENRILPPLPRSEWDLLRLLATGQAGSRWNVPPRRTPVALTASVGTSAAKGDDIETWEWEKYLTGPIRVIERPNSRRFRLPALPGTPQAKAHFDGPAIGYHNYTPRFWRRLYEDMWQLSAVMEKANGGSASGWIITWGGTQLRPMAPSAARWDFFEGVDSKGALLARSEAGAHQGADKDVALQSPL